MPKHVRSIQPTRSDWRPDATEVAAIVAEMRPIIAAFAERSTRELAGVRRAG